MPPSHLLVPLDGSPLADDALAFALENFDCAITVLTVRASVEAGMSEGGIVDHGQSRDEAAREHANEVIEDAKRTAEEGQRDIETVVETGEPAEEILVYVEETDVDHVVMGGHGGDRGHLAKRLLGTTATVVVTEAPVGVTVVR
jgi:nucleotide-binding universal stress UspA family protein